jgi:RNA polymerase sigma-70 factor (ECF subfamily)
VYTSAAPPEEELIARSRTGDLAAFNQLVERYQASVYNLCLRMLGAPQPAEDAAQEAFISAYRHLDKFRGGVFRAWLLRIAANACYDELRRRKARPAASLDESRGEDERTIEAPSPDPTMEEHAERLELRAALESALGRLPDEQRLAIILCDVQGLDYVEIAEVMRCSLGTVKSRINRGRSRLRAILIEAGEHLPSRFRPKGENL